MSFRDYADNLNVTDLFALTEAAVSYLSTIGGRRDFSRLEMMALVRQVEDSRFSREDTLLAFAEMMRSGKIEKQSGGRFIATGKIRFMDAARAAG